ncbi:inositol monophosphatase family protein [Paracoccus sp. 1_MG-2023]|uniref:inositol monophosphatase family protein n=1 Tax=unclassified Paracoccus (in: a-proteobacteria) TaxID=2688777 RepID=UPI001C07F6F3|nr:MULTISPECIES: inositol monophosphatase family protein [unclassified Paracoccus (in: a-proteobacteria)]MBU2958468.1 inositol monophosphatase [Paracoccus sp. C2R09]MDO6668547.1 inositol monophosphatase family protein [Paracoccus sp. 1_MG-2023]
MNPIADLERATAAACAAGDLLMRHWQDREALVIRQKRPGDFVSDADHGAEMLLRDALMRPGDGWLGEETDPLPAPRRWIVDPLDGTTNFLRGIGQWAVSVALEVDGIRVLGVVHDPLRGETFAAARGHGATLNGRAMARPDCPPAGGALWGTGLPFGDMPHIDDHAQDLRRLLPDSAGVRRLGAAALDLAYVAAGRLDGFWERRLRPWDIAAGLVICAEAGIRVEGWTRDDRPEDSGNVIAARPELFQGFAASLRA